MVDWSEPVSGQTDAGKAAHHHSPLRFQHVGHAAWAAKVVPNTRSRRRCGGMQSNTAIWRTGYGGVPDPAMPGAGLGLEKTCSALITPARTDVRP